MKRFPLIGISGSIDRDERTHTLLRSYMRAVLAAGGVPVLLSPDMQDALLESCLDRLDGLLMAGGNDVAPALFGQEPIPQLGEVDPLRDRFEYALVEQAQARRLPTLGICRGIQVMAATLGGTLWQDLPSQYRAPDGSLPLAHKQTAPEGEPSHSVSLVPGTPLAAVLGRASVMVNSFHHQAVADPGPCLTACAFAPDGVIEAVCHRELPFFWGVQWHPERMFESDPHALALFEALIEAAR